MAIVASRWMSYVEAATMLGLSPETSKGLALRRGCPRAGGTVRRHAGDCARNDLGRGRARSLLDYLESHVERLTENLIEARTEMRSVCCETEHPRIEAAREQVFATLV